MFAALRAQVLDAFASVPKPAVIAPHRCPECNELAGDLAAFSGESLPDTAFSKHVWDLPLLSDEAKRYYLPAWLLRAYPEDTWSACDALVRALEADHRWNPEPTYTEAQWLAIDAVLESAAKSGDLVTIENVERARKCIPR
jgi:hypothetical protein